MPSALTEWSTVEGFEAHMAKNHPGLPYEPLMFPRELLVGDKELRNTEGVRVAPPTIEDRLAMALHKSRWSNDDHEFDLILARERAVDLIAALSEQGLALTSLIGQQLASKGGPWTGPILREDVDDIYGGVVPEGRVVVEPDPPFASQAGTTTGDRE